MKMRNKLIATTLAATLAFSSFVTNSNAEPLAGVTTDNHLVTFNSDAPGTSLSDAVITGLQAGETILGIDFRPATGELFALGSTSRLYTINLSTAAATQVGTGQFSPLLDGTDFGFDFNPTVDRIRVVSNTGQNLRLNPLTGAVAGVDTALSYIAGDVAFGALPQITACAYTNNYTPAPETIGGVADTTTLLGVNSSLNQLVLIGGEAGFPSPGLGGVSTRGFLGVNPTAAMGFDISQVSGEALLVMTRERETTSSLWRLRLDSPLNLTRLGAVGTTTIMTDVAAPLLDTTIPTLTVTTPSAPQITQRGDTLVAAGTASDNLQVVSVKYRLVRRGVEGDFVNATGTTAWTFTLSGLARGRTLVEIIATDLHGNESAISSFQVVRRLRRRAVRFRRN
jgi:hypothetical protein